MCSTRPKTDSVWKLILFLMQVVIGSVVYVQDVEVTTSFEIKNKIINDMKLRGVKEKCYQYFLEVGELMSD